MGALQKNMDNANKGDWIFTFLYIVFIVAAAAGVVYLLSMGNCF